MNRKREKRVGIGFLRGRIKKLDRLVNLVTTRVVLAGNVMLHKQTKASKIEKVLENVQHL